MSNSVMEALFDGQVVPWEHRTPMTAEYKAIEQQIENGRKHFVAKMSLDDCQRFQEWENLLRSATHCEQVDTYTHGFTLGALLMLEILEKKTAVVDS